MGGARLRGRAHTIAGSQGSSVLIGICALGRLEAPRTHMVHSHNIKTLSPSEFVVHTSKYQVMIEERYNGTRL